MNMQIPGELLSEQQQAQAKKFQGRHIEEYDFLIFPGQHSLDPRSSAIIEFAQPFCDTPEMSINGILGYISLGNLDREVHWVDIGGGRGVATRAINVDKSLPENIRTSVVDLFDYGLLDLSGVEIEYIEKKHPGSTSAEADPRVVIADAETVELETKADLITSIELIQYLRNPIASLANWYNQLQDEGIMLVAAGHDWSTWIRYGSQHGLSSKGNYPMQDFLDTLTKAGINFGATLEADWENGTRPNQDLLMFSRLGIQKLPGTTIAQPARVNDIWTNDQLYKAVYYTQDQPIIQVIKN
jgi:SAM-dependent methyltransferase